MAFTKTTLGNLNRKFLEYGIPDWREIQRKHNIPDSTLYGRLSRRMNPEYALTLPLYQRCPKIIRKKFRYWHIKNHKITITEELMEFEYVEPAAF